MGLVHGLARAGRRESHLQAAVLAAFRAHGIVMWKMNREKWGKKYAPHVGFRGLPDLAGVLPGGRAIFVECKLPGRALTPHQHGALGMLSKQGAFVCVSTSVEGAQEQAALAIRASRGRE